MGKNEHSFAKFPKDKQQEYLDWLEQGYTKAHATKAVGVGTTLIFHFRRQNKWFGDKEKEAIDRGLETRIDKAEDALYLKTLEGNVIAIMFFLMNRRPEKWEDKRGNKVRTIDDLLTLLPRELSERVKRLLFEEVSKGSKDSLFNGAAEEEEEFQLS